MKSGALVLGLVACAAPNKSPGPAPVRPHPVDRPLAVAPVLAAPERLPHTFEPVRYAARLHVDPGNARFTGSIEIEGQLAEPTAVIWLHGERLMIDRAWASMGAERIPLIARFAKPGVLALQSEQPLPAGTWKLALAYHGAVLGPSARRRHRCDG